MDFEATKEQVYLRYSRRIDKLLADFRQQKEAQVCSICEQREDCRRDFHHLKTLIALMLRQSLKQSLKQKDAIAYIECFEAPIYALDNILGLDDRPVPQGAEILSRRLARLARWFARRWIKESKKGGGN